MNIDKDLIIEALGALVDKKNIELEKAEINTESEFSQRMQLMGYLEKCCDVAKWRELLLIDIKNNDSKEEAENAKDLIRYIDER